MYERAKIRHRLEPDCMRVATPSNTATSVAVQDFQDRNTRRKKNRALGM